MRLTRESPGTSVEKSLEQFGYTDTAGGNFVINRYLEERMPTDVIWTDFDCSVS